MQIKNLIYRATEKKKKINRNKLKYHFYRYGLKLREAASYFLQPILMH